MSSYQYLKLEKRKHIAIVTLNRPKSRNALNGELLLELEQVALSFRDDMETRVVIFTGSGNHFSAGVDLNYLSGLQAKPMLERRRSVRLGERVFYAICQIEQITICAWAGAAIGGAACLATATDLRIGSADCFVQYPEIDMGINLMWQCLPRTMRLVGEARAVRLVIGGERVDAETMLDWGLLEEIVANDKLINRSFELAKFYASKPPIAAQMIKRSINAISSQLDRAMMHGDADQHVLATLSKDYESAMAAYRKNKTVSFSGD